MRGNGKTWPIALSILIALMLTILPLPDWLETFRPSWAALVIVFWSLNLSRRVSIGTAWATGLILDALKGAILGQHALALTVLSFITIKFHLRIRVFPILQQSITIFALIAVYEFMLMWVDGIVGEAEIGLVRWGPVISSSLLWPLIAIGLDRVQRRLRVG